MDDRDGRVRIAQVGLGVRSWCYSEAILDRFRDATRLVGLCDANPGRLAQRRGWARSKGVEVPGYPAEAFERMILETRPDRVLVTTPDRDHDTHLCRAMELGCDVVSEKPLTIDAARLARILETRRRTGRRCVVTFNYRYAPPREQVKEILSSGVVGEVRAVAFQWLLDIRHGADYFRRWHRRKESSGGLLVHKSTHHFDLVNWWLSDVPVEVFAAGSRRHYRPAHAESLGLARRGERCLGCAEASRCPFHLDVSKGYLRALYTDHEAHDGYFRDRCVFSPEIDIEDAASVTVRYRRGAHLAYSLDAAAPHEGFAVSFHGTLGRLEHRCRESTVGADGQAHGLVSEEETHTVLHRQFEAPENVAVRRGDGGHGGGDERLLADLFAAEPGPDPLGLRADERAGAWSCLVGIAANRSLESGAAVRVEDLCPGLALPPGVPEERDA